MCKEGINRGMRCTPLRRCVGRWTVVFVTMTPSIPLTVPIAPAMSSTPRESRSGEILRTSLGRRFDNAVALSRAWTTPRNRFTSNSRFCRPLTSGTDQKRVRSWKDHTHRRPGVLGLETLTTSTSALEANAWTPAIKSSGDSCGLSLFFPKLIARRRSCRNEAECSSVVERNAGSRARRRARTETWPWEGNP